MPAAPAAPPTQGSAFVAGEAGTLELQPPANRQLQFSRAAPVAGVAALSLPCRVTPDGHVERLTVDGWTRVLANVATSFRTVATVGNDIWAGGSGGALFHSADGGQTWKAVSLEAPSGAETGTITSIRFSDAQHGVVVTDNGKRWSTSDGGATWMSE